MTPTETATHTPGPWRVERFVPDDDCDDDGLNILSGYGGDSIAQLAQMDGLVSPQLEADARLIAAAPDLLALLIELRDSHFGAAVREEYEDRVHAILEKVAGR